VSDSPQSNQFLRHWPLGVTVFLLLVAGLLHSDQSEIVRGGVAVVCIALMLYQWQTYRKTSRGGHFVLLSLVVVGVELVSLWLAPNVVRFYTYGRGVDAEGAWGTLYMCVVRTQDVLVWCVKALVVVTFLGTLFECARWLVGRISRSA
jgi:hypothetical protein